MDSLLLINTTSYCVLTLLSLSLLILCPVLEYPVFPLPAPWGTAITPLLGVVPESPLLWVFLAPGAVGFLTSALFFHKSQNDNLNSG